MTPATLIAGAMTYAWPFCTGAGGNAAVAVVYGASSGVFVSLITAPIVRMSRTQEVGVRAGMSMTLVALGAIAGPPVSGAINGATGGFVFTGVFAGGLFLMYMPDSGGIGLLMRRVCRNGGDARGRAHDCDAVRSPREVLGPVLIVHRQGFWFYSMYTLLRLLP